MAPRGNDGDEAAIEDLRRRVEWRESELDALFGHGPVGLAFFDDALRHVRINAHLARLNGHAVEQHLGCTMRQMVPEVASAVEPKLQKVIATGAPILADHVTRPVADPVFVEASYLPILLRDRSVRGVAAVVRDLTELKRMQEAVGERARFERLLTSLTGELGQAAPERVDATVRETLERVCDEYGFIRGSIVQFSDDGGWLEITHEWGEGGTGALASRTRDAELRWLRTARGDLMRHRPVLAPPPGAEASATGPMDPTEAVRERSMARRRCEQAGLLGSVAVPIRGRGLRGAIVFHSDEPVTSLSDTGATRLGVVGQAVFDALAARTAEQERQAAIVQIRQLRGSIPPPAPSAPEEMSIHQAVQRVRATRGLRHVVQRLEAVAPTEATVLLNGESGVGKELIAQFVHARSRRAAAPMVKVNCAAVAPELFESEFFGHTKGAFTGAHRDRQGRFELAHGGTLFLDEVGEIPLGLQPKLLRVLEDGRVERVGDERARGVDVRVVVATNRDLEAEVEAGRFRRDLYHRLSVFPVIVPPLRERREDIPALAQFFLDQYAEPAGRPNLALTDRDLALLGAYDWPGNVRELANVIQRAVILSPEPPLRLRAAMPDTSRPAAADPAEGSFLTEAEVRERERQNILAALTSAGWRVSGAGGAAELLGMAPSTLRDRMRAFGIRRPR